MPRGIENVTLVVDGRVFLLRRDRDRDDQGLVCIDPPEPLSRHDAGLLLAAADLIRPIGCSSGGY